MPLAVMACRRHAEVVEAWLFHGINASISLLGHPVASLEGLVSQA